MNADSLQYRAQDKVLFVEGVAFRLELPDAEWTLPPEGVYRYTSNVRLVNTTNGTFQVALSAPQIAELEAMWPVLVALAVEIHGSQLLEEVVGSSRQQLKQQLLWVLSLLRSDPEVAEEFHDALQVFTEELLAAEADKKEALALAGALEDFDFFADWPTWPPSSY